jgi:hypothetical protein
MVTEYIGAFSGEYYRITVEGYKVPHIIVRKLENDKWDLVLDERFSITASGEEIQRWMWWVANAMAIAGGFTSFGENSLPMHPYNCKMVSLSMDNLKDLNEGKEIDNPEEEKV